MKTAYSLFGRESLIARGLFTLALLSLPARAHAIRAVMEQTPASNNTIIVDTQNAHVGIGTSSAAVTLDVNGPAQFGGPAKSTFTAAGALNMASGANITLSGGGQLVGNAATASTATYSQNISNGGPGMIPYQSQSGTTGLLAAGSASALLGGGAAAPAWSTTASTYTANVSGVAGYAVKLNAAPSQCSAGNYPLGIDQGGNVLNCTAAGAGTITGTGTNGYSAYFNNSAGTQIGAGPFSDTSSSATLTNGKSLLFGQGSTTNVDTSGNTAGNQIITIGTHPTFNGMSYSQASTSSSAGWFSLMFANLDPNAHYRLVIDSAVMTGAADGYFLRFGVTGTTPDSTSGHYSWSQSFGSGGTPEAAALTSDSQCPLVFNNGNVVAGDPSTGSIDFYTFAGTTMNSFTFNDQNSTRGTLDNGGGTCWFENGAAIVNVKIYSGSHVFNGIFNLWRIE